MHQDVSHYFERFGFCERQIPSPPPPDLALVVIIPCFQEEDLLGALESLKACEPSNGAAEVIVVVNSSAKSDPAALLQNQKTWRGFQAWNALEDSPKLKFHALHLPSLPPKHAGVGLARKIGMDEALRRFADINNLNGVMACFDADCRCDSNYLQAIESHFRLHPGTPGCSIYFEHPLLGEDDPALYEAVTNYELHLRYYVQALRYAGLPFAYHTVGSSMAVRAQAYMKQGGMNRRKAGEDFYFLHKIIAMGEFTELNATRVLPSPRPSHRVPFGTGRAVQTFLREGKFESYPLQAFKDLKVLVNWVQAQASTAGVAWPPNQFSGTLQNFLKANQAANALEEMSRHTSSLTAWKKRFFQWFDAFKAMKFIHYARDDGYESPNVSEAARDLLIRTDHTPKMDWSAMDLRGILKVYRDLDRHGNMPI